MSKRAILCVDDEEMVLVSLGDQLENAFGDRYLYEFAEDAEEALEVIEDLTTEEVSILIIVSDWLMPGMKGDEFLIQIHQRFPEIKKIMLTGQADAVAIERAQQQAGLYRYIAKPWDKDTLIKAIEAGLE